jgi:hypothetical protein
MPENKARQMQITGNDKGKAKCNAKPNANANAGVLLFAQMG